ncbi:MAG: DUF3040 domain-containing protein [Acidimicrobiales bacterium]|jgi:hypothetical protein
MPLSEEEQKILHEMEEKLYKHDRAFADRVSTESPHISKRHATRASVVAFIVGFVVLLALFRSSVLLGALGFLIMLVAAVVFVHEAGMPAGSDGKTAKSGTGVSEEWAEMRRRLRSRFQNRG